MDAYNPLESKPGMDVIDLRRRFGHQIGFCGNMDVQLWAAGTLDEIKAAALTKLNAAKGGGSSSNPITPFQTTSQARGTTMFVKLIRDYGKYPLRLGEYDLAMS